MSRQHDYSHVHIHDQHDDDSSTEVESLVGAEKKWTSDDFHHTSQRSNRRVLCRPLVAALGWVLVVCLQLVIIGLLARDQGLLESTRWRGRSTSAHDVGGDITGWGQHSMSGLLPRPGIITDVQQFRHKLRRSKSTKLSHRTTLPSSSSPTCYVRGMS